MEKKVFIYETTGRVFLIVTMIILPLFYYFQQVNPQLYHISIEFMISIVAAIAAAIAALTSNKSQNNLMSRMSPGILFYAFLVFIHSLAYPDMNIFADQGFNLATTIKVCANLLLASGMFFAVLDKSGRFSIIRRFIFFIFFTLILTSFALFELFPPFLVNNQLTPLKIIFQSIIVALMISSFVILLVRKDFLLEKSNRLIIISFAFLIVSETFFFRFLSGVEFIAFFALSLRFIGLMLILYNTINVNLLRPFNLLYESIIQEKNNELELKHQISLNLFRLTKSQEIGHVGTWELDLNTNLIWASDEAFRIYGLTLNEDNILEYDLIKTAANPKDRPILNEAMRGLIEENLDYNVTFSIQNFLGEVHYINSIATMEFDEEGKPFKVHGVIHDVTRLKLEQEKLLYASIHDALTDLYNRRYFMEQREKLDYKKYLPFSTAILDINGLKIINDSFGHHAGNQILKRLATILEEHIKERGHFVARIGGDEFAIMMPNTEKETAEAKMKDILEQLESEEVANVKISVAFGIVTRTTMEKSFDETLKDAEDEMYLYKIADSASVRNKIIDALLKTLYEKDIYSEEHSQRVSDYAFLLAKACDLSQKKINDIKIAGLVHDIGKITISNEILNKKGRLTDEEYSIIKMHSEKGYRIIHSMGDMDIIANYVLQHHEFYNGKGYPKQLSGNDISIEARIISIADSYDAMTSYREYKPQMSKPEAIKELLRCKGTQFDPELVDLFIEHVLSNE